jgi:hypothetical protein
MAAAGSGGAGQASVAAPARLAAEATDEDEGIAPCTARTMSST